MSISLSKGGTADISMGGLGFPDDDTITISKKESKRLEV